MLVWPYSSKQIRNIVTLYRQTFPDAPINNNQIYIDEDSMMWDGYIQPVEEIHDLFSDLFRFARNKKEIDIKMAQEIGGTDNLTIQELAFFIADILIHEKTHQGLFATMLKNGVIERIINRLEVLLNSHRKFWWVLF